MRYSAWKRKGIRKDWQRQQLYREAELVLDLAEEVG
jgi:hypothetical protein